MRFDFSGAEIFLACLEGAASVAEVLAHPAYQTVQQHAALFSEGISAQDLEKALEGGESPFYGLGALTGNLSKVRRLLKTIRANQEAWLVTATASLKRLFPGEDLEAITIYPILGYDMGIGLQGAICMNLNTPQYLAQPEEFFYFIIHEAVHVLYERSHRVPALRELDTGAQWLAFFKLMLQNEGYAVYAPLDLRKAGGHLDDRDYRVLFDPDQLEAHRRAFEAALERLELQPEMPQEEILEVLFGPQRLTYRIGCEIIRGIEQSQGLKAVREAFYLDGEGFLETYGGLLRG